MKAEKQIKAGGDHEEHRKLGHRQSAEGQGSAGRHGGTTKHGGDRISNADDAATLGHKGKFPDKDGASPPPEPAAAIDKAREAARHAHLRYVVDTKPGITRARDGDHFAFRFPDGTPVTDEAEIQRIRKLAIPPAYTDVWICPHENGHIQATGRDARGRKQYRYHARWRAARDEAKYGKMMLFGRVLPRIRNRVEQDLRKPGLPREKVLATIVRLMETTLIRIGNTEYARDNHSFGLTTLRHGHVKGAGATLHLDFYAKHHIHRDVAIHEKRLLRIIEKCRDLPGRELFQYLDEHGQRHPVDSGDVNDYLRAISGGEDITAKDFRTWAATTLAALALQEFETVDNAAHAKKNVLRAIEKVATELGNTPAICRKCYIHPAVFEAYLDGSLLEGLKARIDETLREQVSGLSGEEAAVLAFLHDRLAREPVTTRPPGRKKAA